MAPTDRNSIGRTATDISDITGSCLTMTPAKAIRVSTSETVLLVRVRYGRPGARVEHDLGDEFCRVLVGETADVETHHSGKLTVLKVRNDSPANLPRRYGLAVAGYPLDQGNADDCSADAPDRSGVAFHIDGVDHDLHDPSRCAGRRRNGHRT